MEEENASHDVNKQSKAILVTMLPNNKISKKLVNVTCFLRSRCNNTISPCRVDLIGAGQYSIQYTPTCFGRHELAVSVEGQQVAGSPFPVFVSICPTQLGYPVKVWWDLRSPTGIAVNSIGEILVCEYEGRIIKFNREGKKKLFINQNILTGLRKIEVDDRDNIYCVSIDSNQVFICDQNGGNRQVKVIPQVNGGCFDLAVIGEEVMIAGRENKGIVNVYDRDLNYKRCITMNNMGHILAVCGGSHSDLYCSDFENSCVHVFSNDGVFLHSFGCDKSFAKKAKYSHGLCVSGHYVYVCTNWCQNVSVFTIDGVYLTSFGDFRFPHSVCVDNDGFVCY